MAAANSGSVGRGKAFQPKVVNSGMNKVDLFVGGGAITPVCPISREATQAIRRSLPDLGLNTCLFSSNQQQTRLASSL